MRTLKKTTAAAIAASLVLTSIGVVNVSAATATSVKVVNGKKHTMTVGDSIKIVVKANGSVTYKSSNKKIVKVSSKGKAKAVKAGKATVTVKGASKSVKVKFTVKPGKVKSVTAAKSGDKDIKVSWKKVSGATGYEVYSSTNAKSGFSKVATVKSGKTVSTVVKNLAASKTHYFKVKAYTKSGGKTIKGEYSKVTEGIYIWGLVWSDEFNGNSLDTNTWTFETGHGNDGWGNQEWQDYQASGNYKVENGSLVIIPRVDYNKSTQKFLPDTATSTRIKTYGKKEFKYGKMEIRAKSTKALASWSAGWMLGSNCYEKVNEWPKCGEIDIMEGMNGGVPQTIHCPYFNNLPSAPGGNKNYDTGLTQAVAAADFHTYTALWTDTYIEFSVDGKYVGKFDPSKYPPEKKALSWVFDHNFFFILNCAIGGNASGVDPDVAYPNPYGWKVVKTNGDIQTLEDYFYVDYVRVYK